MRDYQGVEEYNGSGSYLGQMLSGNTRLDLTARHRLDPSISSTPFWSGDANFRYSNDNAGVDSRVFLSSLTDQFSFASAAHVRNGNNLGFVSVAGGPLGSLERFGSIEVLPTGERLIKTSIVGLGENESHSDVVSGIDSTKFGPITKNVNVAVGMIVPYPLSSNYQMMIGYQFMAPNPLNSDGHFLEEIDHGTLFMQFYLNPPNP